MLLHVSTFKMSFSGSSLCLAKEGTMSYLRYTKSHPVYVFLQARQLPRDMKQRLRGQVAAIKNTESTVYNDDISIDRCNTQICSLRVVKLEVRK